MKKRYFMLTQSSLLYFKTPSDTNPLGSINIESILMVKKYGNDLLEIGNSTFDLITSNRIYTLVSENREEMEHWILAINQQINR